MGSERARHQLYEEVHQVFSDEAAGELMGALPPVGWGDVATKQDLVLVRGEIAMLRTELRGEIAELRSEIAGVRGELGQEVAGVRQEMAEGFRSVERRMVTVGLAATGLFSATLLGAVQIAVG